MTDDIRYDGRAWHVALTIAGPMSENEIDGFAQHGYVGVLSEPAVFSRFIETTLSPPAVAIFDASMVLGNIDRLLRVDVMTEAHWDYLYGEHGTVADDVVVRLTQVAEGKFDSMSLDLLREAVDEIERLRADNERLLRILHRSLPKRLGVLGNIDDEAAVDDVTHPALSGELGEIAEMETTFVDVRGDQHD